MKRGTKGSERTRILSEEEREQLKGVKNGVKSCGEEKKGKNKRVVDSFMLQHPILDYIRGSCFLCVVFMAWPQEKAAKISFNLMQKLKCLSATPTRGA